jgi:hypothetical protein
MTPPELKPTLDIRLIGDAHIGMRYGVFLRPRQGPGGRVIAKFADLELAEAFVTLYPALALKVRTAGLPDGKFGVISGGKG